MNDFSTDHSPDTAVLPGGRPAPPDVIVIDGHAMTHDDLRGAWQSEKKMVQRERRLNWRIVQALAALVVLRGLQLAAVAEMGLSAAAIAGWMIALEGLAAGIAIGSGLMRLTVAVMHRHERRVLFGPGGPKAAKRCGFGPDAAAADDTEH